MVLNYDLNYLRSSTPASMLYFYSTILNFNPLIWHPKQIQTIPLLEVKFSHIFSNLKGSIFLLTTHEYSRFYRIKSWVDLVLRRLMLVTPPTKQSKLQQYAHTHKHILSTVIILRLSQPQDLVLGTLLWERSIKTLPLICSPNNIIFLKLLFLQHQNQSESSSYPYKFSLKQKSVLPQTLCFHQKNFLYFTLGADII